MDYRCPHCRANLKKRKMSHAIVARMEFDCSQCKRTIRLNIHPAEMSVVLFCTGTVIALGAMAYWFESRELVLLAFAIAAVGTAALFLLDHIYLRDWPRYASVAPKSEA